MFIDRYIKQYIRDQWVNYRKALNEPQAREKTLAGAKLYFYEKETTVPKYVYSDEGCNIPFPHPVIADSSGEFQPIYLETMAEDQYEVVLKTQHDESLIQCSTHEGFEV
jgi:hypothetical protein